MSLPYQHPNPMAIGLSLNQGMPPDLNVSPEIIPPQLLVEVFSELRPEIFAQRLPALNSLLRMALLGGMEMSFPVLAQLVLDIADGITASDRQLILLGHPSDPHLPHLQIPRQWPQEPPPREENLLHHWAMAAGQPILARPGMEERLDRFLSRLGMAHAVAIPLFSGHGPAGSLQLYRLRPPAFEPADAHLLWIVSLLAETQIAHSQALQHLLRFAFNDYLTGLKTRRYFEQALEQEVKRALRNRSSCALLLLDLDDFKQINDSYGHHIGDETLRQLARILTRDMREIDTVARFGGDEFAVILPDTDHEGARFVATRLREAVRQTPIQAAGTPGLEQPLHLDLSLGIALAPRNATSPVALLRAADTALYQAKRNGKHRYFFSQDRRLIS